VKICPVDPEIIGLKLKKEEINTSKIYSPSGKFASGKFAERATKVISRMSNFGIKNFHDGVDLATRP